MGIETDLSVSPYFDDYDETKQFHRVLFRPGYSVQARELTQLQTLMQNQIERFASEIMIDGTVVTGVGLTTDNIDYVKLRDKDANSRVLFLSNFYESGNLMNLTVEGETTGVSARIVDVKDGSEVAAPDYFTLYLYYTNSGANNSTKVFADGETLNVRRSSNSQYILSANTISSESTGLGLKANISDGVVYHKGNFIRCPAQSIIAGKYTTQPSVKIGLRTIEDIIDPNQDSSLLDNSTGSTNASAPGAARLRLTPTLTTYPYSFANTENFFTIATVKTGSVEQRNENTVYSDLGKYIAERMYDANGNFVMEPFNIRIREHLKKPNSLGKYASDNNGDSQKVVAEIEKGSGYVNGYRVALNEATFLDVDKGVDLENSDSILIGQTFGNYVVCDEVVGRWDFSTIKDVKLMDTAQTAITNRNYSDETVNGTQIGSAKVRGFQYDSGRAGTSDCQWRIYLFDIQMNSGKTFSDVRSFHIDYTSGIDSIADVVLTNGIAKLQDTSLSSLVFTTGFKGVKSLTDSTGSINNDYVVRKKNVVSFNTSGEATFGAGNVAISGTERFNDIGNPSGSQISNVDERNFVVVTKTETETLNHSGQIDSISGNIVTGDSGCDFLTTYRSGDIIEIEGSGRAIVIVVNSNTELRIDHAIGDQSIGYGANHKTVFPRGHIWDLSTNGTIATTQSTASIDLGIHTLASSFDAEVYYDVNKVNATSLKKTVFKNKYVKINTATHSASENGPWSLGVSDAFKINKVYLGDASDADTSDTDVTLNFILDDGQKDGYYDTSFLKKRLNSSLDLQNKYILVEFNYFGRDDSTGYGFCSMDSYTDIIDDDDLTATDKITTQEIPVFRSPLTGRDYDLRNSVDFRIKKQNTETPSSVVASAPVNPSVLTAFDYNTNYGVYTPTPDENFETAIQYYLPRKDRIVVSQRGNFEVVRGIPDINPRTPLEPNGTMTLAVLDVPVYPSLSPYVGRQYNRTDYQVKMRLENNRRYTMQDLRAVEQRVKTLEYYSSLNALESSAKDKQIFNSTGQDRFKNGFLVDNFDGHNVAETKSPYYRAAIDRNKSHLRPTFVRNDISFKQDLNLTSVNTVTKGDLIMLEYDHELFVEQPYATKKRNPVQELLFNWRGQVILNPDADNTPDITTLPDIQIDFDGIYESMEQIAQAAGITAGVDYGTWNVSSGERREGGRIVRDIERTVTTTSISAASETMSLGNFVTDVSLREYMRSIPVQFTGVRMRPNTEVYPYFDDEDVRMYVTPTNSSFVPTGNEGDKLSTDATGTVYGIFRIPNDEDVKFRVGTKRFLLTDVNDPTVDSDTVTTSAHGEFTSSGLDITQRGASVNMKVPQISKETRVETKQQWTVLDRDNGWQDPIAQTFFVNISGSNTGCFITKIDIFFARRSEDLPITLQIREMENGFPTDIIVPYGQKTLYPSEIAVWDGEGTPSETTFEFDTPAYLENNKDYAMVLIPGGNSDDYLVWVAQLGGTDTSTGTLISKQSYTGVLFTSSNDNTWSPIQNEDMMFKIHRAKFDTSKTGTVYLENDNIDFITYDTLDGQFRLHEEIIGGTSNARGKLIFHDVTTKKMHIRVTSGTFQTGESLTGDLTDAETTLVSFDDVFFNTLVPKVPQIVYPRTSATWQSRVKPTFGSIPLVYKPIELSLENDFYDSEKTVVSYSESSGIAAVNGSNKTVVLKGTFNTQKDTVSPIVDITRMNGIAVQNIINDSSGNEDNESGNALVRYFTKPVVLADGQEAEDLVVYVSAYKPQGTGIAVYARLLNDEDPEGVGAKDFTPLTQVTPTTVYSEGLGKNDFKEYEYSIPSRKASEVSSANTHAYLNSENNDILQYNGNDGAIYKTYKTFVIKIVLTSASSAIIPVVNDMRAIALQK